MVFLDVVQEALREILTPFEVVSAAAPLEVFSRGIPRMAGTRAVREGAAGTGSRHGVRQGGRAYGVDVRLFSGGCKNRVFYYSVI